VAIQFPSNAVLFGVLTGAWLATAANWWVKVIQARSFSDRLPLSVAAGLMTLVAIGFVVGLLLFPTA